MQRKLSHPARLILLLVLLGLAAGLQAAYSPLARAHGDVIRSEPAANTQPSGTGISVAWRGAKTVEAAAGTPWEDAGNYDPYGDGFDSGQLQKLGLPVGNEFTVTFHPTSGDNSWKNDVTQINGARFVQFRVTFLANAESGLIPELSALGFAFSK